jgi:ABC-type uncharacterized transport system permease subunit
MEQASIFWLRFAALLYGVGLLHALWSLLTRDQRLWPLARICFGVGIVFHFVSLVDRAMAVEHVPADNFFETISLGGFLIALVAGFAFVKYQFPSLGLIVFPLVFAMTLAGALGTPVGGWTSPRVRGLWLLVHVVLVLAGYAALLLAAAASIFYLVQERHLKEKKSTGMPGMPALMTLDKLLTNAMGLGFVLITLALLVGSTWAFVEFGTRWITDPKIILSLLTWVAYLFLMYLRNTAGWRGRKAALVTLSVIAFSALTWAAHVGLQSRVFSQ